VQGKPEGCQGSSTTPVFLLQVLLTSSDGKWCYVSSLRATLSISKVLLLLLDKGNTAERDEGVKCVGGYSTDPKGREGYSAQPFRGSSFMGLLPLPSVNLRDATLYDFVFPYSLIRGCIVPTKERKLLFTLTLSRQERPVQIK